MAQFYAPYNFIPVTGQCNGAATPTADAAALAAGTTDSPARHDVWQPGTHSGRLLCALTTCSPVAVGSRQEPAEPTRGEASPKRVQLYTDATGQPAIPASSLRGMVSSIAEAVSQSSLRVLEDKHYSVRKAAKPGQALSAIGRLVMSGNGDIRLEPMSFPMLAPGSVVSPAWLRAFAINPATDPVANRIAGYLPAYVDGYEPAGDGVRLIPGTHLAQPGARVSSTNDVSTHWFAHSAPMALTWDRRQNTINYQDPALRASRKVLRNRLAADPSPHQGPNDKAGRIKVLGFVGHESEVPRGKKHELFLFDANPRLPSLQIAKYALDNFRLLCRDAEARAPEFLPFRNAGAPDSLEEAARQGQLVFFDVALPQGVLRVVEFSYSAIWRRQVRGSTHAAIRKIGPHLAPMDGQRDRLTPAELLFGVVREDRSDSDDRSPESGFKALASRVRFSDALAPFGTVRRDAEVKLQILSTPKPPSPSMYFGQHEQSGPLSKATLDLEVHRPNGRKVYLPFPQNQRTTANASSGNAEPGLDQQKLKVAPISSGQIFHFEVCYENLSEDELGLLLTALRPAKDFEHRLGLGKPLGLGHVRIDVIALDDRLRSSRYSSAAFLGAEAGPAFVDETTLPGELPAALASWRVPLANLTQAAPWQASEPWRACGAAGLVDSHTLQILCKLGDVRQLQPGVPLQYPRSTMQVAANGRPIGEDKLFEWFVNNDRAGAPQSLGKVDASEGVPLPTLTTNLPPSR